MIAFNVYSDVGSDTVAVCTVISPMIRTRNDVLSFFDHYALVHNDVMLCLGMYMVYVETLHIGVIAFIDAHCQMSYATFTYHSDRFDPDLAHRITVGMNNYMANNLKCIMPL